MIEWLRGEMVGPSRQLVEPQVATFVNRDFTDLVPLRRGQLVWSPSPDEPNQEVLYYDRESPHRKYGMGLLHVPAQPAIVPGAVAQNAMKATDTMGADSEPDDQSEATQDEDEELGSSSPSSVKMAADNAEDFEVTSPDVRHPSTLGITFCVSLEARGAVIVQLPRSRHFIWQPDDTPEFQLNGRYESCTRRWTDDNGVPKNAPVWRRLPAVLPDTMLVIERSELVHGRVVRKDVQMPTGSPLALRLEVFPRAIQGQPDVWLLTIVLRNSTDPAQVQNEHESTLYQTFFEVFVKGGRLEKYPESRRPFGQLDPEEQSLALLYRESATWGIGHGCAAGWDAEVNQAPESLYADVMPAVELPSMTPDITLDGATVQLSMRALANLPDSGVGAAWSSLDNLCAGYAAWIQQRQQESSDFPTNLREVADRHLSACGECLNRINTGLQLLRDQSDDGARARRAFRLANLAMLLQQIATKQLPQRGLAWNAGLGVVAPEGDSVSPWDVYQGGIEDNTRLGSWRAFQVAFLLMSLDGVRNGQSPDRELVDLVWFPTGGGKTEAYLAVMAFYMFHERLLTAGGGTGPRRDGTNVIMRYTLRMLTTQQFQRAASLICAMEFLRRNPTVTGMGNIAGQRFSLGLWIGGDGSPNKCSEAKTELSRYRNGKIEGNPLVLTECPWCRSTIGRYDGAVPNAVSRAQRTVGIREVAGEGPLLHCADGNCSFGQPNHSDWIPVEVIDERIYQHPPSLVIATADKFAMITYRPWHTNPDRPGAAALFGRHFLAGNLRQVSMPPGLIIQDELHLISGPLGTMYALYEGIIEKLCSIEHDGHWIKPKLIASTATIRGAAEQVRSLYARSETRLFPSPGLLMGDSFFGRYARETDGRLSSGRLYLGIHANDYGSVLTTQVRTYSSALFRPFRFDADRRDPWWTLMAFYNSIRELGGAKTLFDSDIRSRLKFMFNREGFGPADRRNLRIVEELTSRLSQADIVMMMNKLALPYSAAAGATMLDACLASNIIEVGVDIDRLSLMGVVGQPKTTSTYIQVTGRVGRRWRDRPGLILMVYNPSKSRDRSHFEQFHSYHRRLYERVEPTTATPFAVSALQRGLCGALLAWARVNCIAPVQNPSSYLGHIQEGLQLLRDRCEFVQAEEDLPRSLTELDRLFAVLRWKWDQNPQDWEKYPPNVNGQYLMLWPGQFYSGLQKRRGVNVPSSMRQVDRSAELTITPGYVPTAPAVTAPAVTPPTTQSPNP